MGIGAICEFCLKPYSEIVITSSTIPQASKLVEKKIRDEIIKKLDKYFELESENIGECKQELEFDEITVKNLCFKYK